MEMKNLPNLLTGFRIAIVPMVILFMFIQKDWANWTALFLFILAAVTDFFDGYLARKHEVQSDLGAILDPIADKFLVLAALLMLIEVDILDGVHVLAAIIILGREILVAGLREFLAKFAIKLPVTLLAKWKTTIQMTAIGFLIAGPAGTKVIPWSIDIGLVGLWFASIVTVVTGYQYAEKGFLKMMAVEAHEAAIKAGTIPPDSPLPTSGDEVAE